MREAAYGMGCTPTQSLLKVILPVGMPGIITGVVLAVARAAGETAPLLFTALFSESWLAPNEPTASLAVLIYNWSSSPYENLIELAWAASLILVCAGICSQHCQPGHGWQNQNLIPTKKQGSIKAHGSCKKNLMRMKHMKVICLRMSLWTVRHHRYITGIFWQSGTAMSP